VADGAPLTSHDRPDDTRITGNTLVNNTRNYFMTPRDKGLGATRTTFSGNTIVRGGPAASLDGPYLEGVWRDNVIWQTGPGALPSGSYREKQPDLQAPTPLTPATTGVRSANR
jgi:poly(beta-D-mannuronate) lyase